MCYDSSNHGQPDAGQQTSRALVSRVGSGCRRGGGQGRQIRAAQCPQDVQLPKLDLEPKSILQSLFNGSRTSMYACCQQPLQKHVNMFCCAWQAPAAGVRLQI